MVISIFNLNKLYDSSFSSFDESCKSSNTSCAGRNAYPIPKNRAAAPNRPSTILDPVVMEKNEGFELAALNNPNIQKSF